jgi:hypothetical protein
VTTLEACHFITLREGEESGRKELKSWNFVKMLVFMVFAVIGFFVLWGMTFLLCFALALDTGLSLLLGFSTSAVTIFAFITILMPP